MSPSNAIRTYVRKLSTCGMSFLRWIPATVRKISAEISTCYKECRGFKFVADLVAAVATVAPVVHLIIAFLPGIIASQPGPSLVERISAGAISTNLGEYKCEYLPDQFQVCLNT